MLVDEFPIVITQRLSKHVPYHQKKLAINASGKIEINTISKFSNLNIFRLL